MNEWLNEGAGLIVTQQMSRWSVLLWREYIIIIIWQSMTCNHYRHKQARCNQSCTQLRQTLTCTVLDNINITLQNISHSSNRVKQTLYSPSFFFFEHDIHTLILTKYLFFCINILSMVHKPSLLLKYWIFLFINTIQHSSTHLVKGYPLGMMIWYKDYSIIYTQYTSG